MADDKKKKGDEGGEQPKKKPQVQLSPEDEAKRAARAAKKSGKGGGAAAVAREEQKQLPKAGPARMRLIYKKEVVPTLMKEGNYKNVFEVPRITKITINMGLGEATSNPKILDTAVEELATITGQKPVITKAKKSIASFKLREGQSIGTRVTLRGEKMYEFLDRLINIALPRVRDFRGVPTKSFDGRGNYTLGIRDHVIFPEIDVAKVDKSKGMNITIVTTAKNDEQARFLLRELGMPFGR